MDPYFELFALRECDYNQYLDLCKLSFIQHSFQIYLIYILFMYYSPIVAIVFACYSEVFLSLYLSQQLHFAWTRRMVEQNDNNRYE